MTAPGSPDVSDPAGLGARLQRDEFFRNVDRRTVEAMIAGAVMRNLRPGHELLRQGDSPDHLHMVVQGCFKLSHVQTDGKQLTVRYMGLGDLIGCVAVFRRVPYPVTALAVADSAVLTWPAPYVLTLIQQDPHVAGGAVMAVSRRTVDMLDRVRGTSTEGAEQRIARALLDLCERLGRPAGTGREIGFPLSRHDIAELTAVSHYTVSRIMSDWESRGLVRSGRRRVVVLDLPGMSQIAASD